MINKLLDEHYWDELESMIEEFAKKHQIDGFHFAVVSSVEDAVVTFVHHMMLTEIDELREKGYKCNKEHDLLYYSKQKIGTFYSKKQIKKGIPLVLNNPQFRKSLLDRFSEIALNGFTREVRSVGEGGRIHLGIKSGITQAEIQALKKELKHQFSKEKNINELYQQVLEIERWNIEQYHSRIASEGFK